jgi:hypothetical protein
MSGADLRLHFERDEFVVVTKASRSLHFFLFHRLLYDVMMVVVDHVVVVVMMHSGLHLLGLGRIFGEGRSGHQHRHRCGS